jgi:serine/threonine protein kinase
MPPRQSNGAAEQLKSWELRFSDLTLERAIGQGSYGRVFLARLHETPCAVKLLLSWQEGGGNGGGGNGNTGAFGGGNNAGGSAAVNGGGDGSSAALAGEQRHTLTLSSPLLADLRREAGVMAALHHPNCVQLMGICADPAAIVTEYCPRGSLYDVLSTARRDPVAARQLTWTRRLHLAMGAAQGMLHLHTRTPPVLHRDIKSPNILVNAAWKAKVCDLNLAKAAAGLSSQLSSAGALNPRWLAPEVLAGGGASLASDVFSFGVVLWELLTWQAPWSEVGGNPWQLAAGVISGKRPAVPPREALPGPDTAQFGGLDAYIALMQRCWATDPAERPGFAEVVRQLRALLSAASRAGAASGSRATAAGST